jgi:acyl-CoA synthetase (AMP-forming)/AMP-acid ligase II
MLDGARPLSALSKERAELSPEAPFLFTATEAVRFREAEERATALAAALAHQGVEAGDRVAILLPGCVEFVYTFLALTKLGAVAVPLDPRLTESEVRYLLRHAEATALVTVERFGGADFLERLEAWFPQLPELQFAVTVGRRISGTMTESFSSRISFPPVGESRSPPMG